MRDCVFLLFVVIYHFSTSNHYYFPVAFGRLNIVLYRFSTSNHNSSCISNDIGRLYYIVSLHQTTTNMVRHTFSMCCIISFLYIKPQLRTRFKWCFGVVLYRFSTSNHNLAVEIALVHPLYYIVSLHQTTTMICNYGRTDSYIISFLYIKPQLWGAGGKPVTSCIISFLYIKPQHGCINNKGQFGCIISFLYIKPQRERVSDRFTDSCIISFLYIKPQLRYIIVFVRFVVLYRFSTSNHNIYHLHP